MVRRLEVLGARVLVLPTIEIVPPTDPGPLLTAAAAVETYGWVVLTSVSGVRALADAMSGVGLDPAVHGPGGWAVVGTATARAAEELGWTVDLAPDDFTGEGLLDAFRRSGADLSGCRILLPVAEAARDNLPAGLRELGADVTRVVAYRSVPPIEEDLGAIRAELEEGGVDLLTFTSPSTARHFLDAMGPAAVTVPVAAIGPVTAAAVEEMGYRVATVAPVHTAEALVDAVVRHFCPKGSGA
ncbi:MAG TPA: uroporphyrinogen-III synthase [Longimicrobiales bacterium]|jgi:uroporphyrinogen III methyltransferase/synthase